MTSVRFWLATLAAAFTSSGAVAQYVWPAGYASAAGNAVLNSPFSVRAGHPTTTTRCMVVIDPTTLPFGSGTTLTQLSLRRDRSYASQAYTGGTGTLRVRLGGAVTPPDQLADVRFERQWQSPPTEVFLGSFTLPNAAAPGSALPPFSVVIPFTKTFTYQGGPLAVDIMFTAASGSSTWRVDGFAVPEPIPGTFRSVGAGCRGSNGYIGYHYPFPETAVPGSVLTVQLEGAVRGASGTMQDYALHMVGLSSTFSGVTPLPVDLATILGTPVGCMLRIDPMLTKLVPVSNPSLKYHRAIGQVAIPSSAAFAGASIYSQWLLFDNGVASPFRATVSDALQITLGPVPPAPATRRARTIWRYGAESTPFSDDCGRMVPNGYAPILRFN
jgi:hypothetical protein